MPRESDQRPKCRWVEIAQQVTQEHNPAKMIKLIKELNEAMLAEEREKVKRRLGIPAAEPPVAYVTSSNTEIRSVPLS